MVCDLAALALAATSFDSPALDTVASKLIAEALNEVVLSGGVE
jgi:hypothetical protein